MEMTRSSTGGPGQMYFEMCFSVASSGTSGTGQLAAGRKGCWQEGMWF